jgi:hypothetical protein
MGSLITALQNQNIAAANQETLGDLYAANPTNLGYTDNPFGYTAAPAVIQTAYPKYGYNATAPMMPPSYEDYDLTTLFSMLQGMQAPQQDGYFESFMDPVPMVAPMAEGQAPVTPAGILAAMSTQPLSGSYRVPGTEPVVAEPEPEEEEVVVAPAAPAMSEAEMVARNIAGPELRRRAEAASNRALPRNISADEAFLMMNYE